jgi:hypothetical protein
MINGNMISVLGGSAQHGRGGALGKIRVPRRQAGEVAKRSAISSRQAGPNQKKCRIIEFTVNPGYDYVLVLESRPCQETKQGLSS